MSHYRDKQQREVDIVLEFGGGEVASQLCRCGLWSLAPILVAAE